LRTGVEARQLGLRGVNSIPAGALPNSTLEVK
jgi:hypothetical protein